MRDITATKNILRFLGTLVLLFSSGVDAFDLNDGPQSFDQLCQRDEATGYPADPDIVNCWGFESEADIYYHDPDGSNSPCKDDNGSHILADHPHGFFNPVPIQNASVNPSTCLYPQRTPEYSSSGTQSMKIVQVDEGGGNSGGTFRPYFKHYIGADGRQKFAGFGAGGEVWIHWRYRQNNELFQYHSKRFMATEEASFYEHVLIAVGDANGSLGSPPYKYACTYAYKGLVSHGCSETVYEANKWHTFVMHVKIPDSVDDQAQTSNGLFELYMDGERVVHHPNYRVPAGCCTPANIGAYNDALDFETQHSGNVLMRLDFLLFENGKNGPDDTSPDRPMGIMYIDDVIVSRKQLPTILPNGEAAPNAPSALQAN